MPSSPRAASIRCPRLSPDVSWPRGPFTIGLDIAGEGLSPAGLVAGLNGGGTLFVDPGVLQNLSPAPLKRVARTVLRSRKIKLDKDQIAAQTKAVRDTLNRGTYPYGAAELPFKIDNGTLKVAPATLANKASETTINGYVELASLRVDSEWVMRLAGDNSAELPPVNIVFAGPLADAGSISPAIDTAPIETYLTVRRMQEDVERLENLDVSGRGQPQADTDAAEDAASDADTDNDAADTGAPAAGTKLSNEKAAIEQRAVERAAAAQADREQAHRRREGGGTEGGRGKAGGGESRGRQSGRREGGCCESCRGETRC